jgi:AP-1 complex subunit gamma-1
MSANFNTNFLNLRIFSISGYPTHFGQLECLKLIASPHFPEKRIGYLGMMLLLSEEADVLMLSTNSLKNDMNAQNKFVAGLALCTIGNLATADMSRDLAPEVDKHLKSSLPYLRKKANLAMARCLSKCPDMVEDFVDRVVTLLKDKNHGVLITVVQLMTQVLMIDFLNAQEEGENPFETDCRKAFLRLVPMLVKMLRNLLSSGSSPEYDIGGIADPFLQVQLLTLLRLLGTKNGKASEEMNDVLAQVATNTESSKNAGNAILYECVQTIMGIESEDGLRVLAVNILGRFLLNRDNNIRYVALNTLSRCIIEQQQSGRAGDSNSASSALQKHRSTVVDCLKDPDISIRQRALELIYHLVNQDNVESLTAELLNYLVLCPREHRADICSRILKVVDRFSPDDRWRVDTLITMLTIAGREATREVQSASVIYISSASEDIHTYATHKLLKAIRDDDGSQRGLLVVGIWCIGEYGDLLLNPYSYIPSQGASDLTNGAPVSITFMALDPLSVVQSVENITTRYSCPEYIKHRALTCFAKLSDRFADKGDVAALNLLQKLVKQNQGSHSLELQLRSCEYDALLNAAKGIKPPPKAAAEDDLFGVADDGGGPVSASVISAAKEALSRMPVVDMKILQKRREEAFGDNMASISAPKAPSAAAPAPGGDLLDIFGSSEPAPAPEQNGAASGGEKSDLDLLTDIFAASAATADAPATGGGYDPFSAPPPAQTGLAVSNPLDIFGAPPPTSVPAPTPALSNPLDIFGAPPPMQQQQSMPAAMAQPTAAAPQPMMGAALVSPAAGSAPAAPVIVPAFSVNGLTVEFECTKSDLWNKQASVLVARCKNAAPDAIYGFNLQCAVPKYVTMEMEPPSSTTVPVTGGNNPKLVTQRIKVTNSMLGTKNLMLKLKLSFTLQGNKVEHMATCSGFPAGEY